MELQQLKQAIERLSEQEAKSLLLLMSLQITRLHKIGALSELHEIILAITNELTQTEQETMYKRLHIVFEGSLASTLKAAIKVGVVGEEEQVISLSDLFSVGPVWQLHEEIGLETRRDWMTTRMPADCYEGIYDHKHELQPMIRQLHILPTNAPITIWVANNANDQTGLRYVVYVLKGLTNEIQVINVSSLYAQHDKCLDHKLHAVYEQSKLATALSQQERKQLEKEWLTLADSRDELRLWRNGKIEGAPVTYYDLHLVQGAHKLHKQSKTTDYIHAARLIGEVLEHMDPYIVGFDAFLQYRLKELIQTGVFEAHGSLDAMRFYKVKLRSCQA